MNIHRSWHQSRDTVNAYREKYNARGNPDVRDLVLFLPDTFQSLYTALTTHGWHCQLTADFGGRELLFQAIRGAGRMEIAYHRRRKGNYGCVGSFLNGSPKTLAELINYARGIEDTCRCKR